MPKNPKKYPGFPVKKDDETEVQFEERIIDYWTKWRSFKRRQKFQAKRAEKRRLKRQ